MHKSERKKRIEQVIIEFLSPEFLIVEDDSKSHKGHINAPEAGESHFNITIKSKIFVGKSRVERERMVHKLLADELKTGLHAVSLKLSIS